MRVAAANLVSLREAREEPRESMENAFAAVKTSKRVACLFDEPVPCPVGGLADALEVTRFPGPRCDADNELLKGYAES